MRPKFRTACRFASVLSAAVLLAQPAVAKPAAKPAAQTAAASANADPWLYRGSDIPHDKEWVFGELPNGLRYAVRRNGVPPGQVSIRIRIDAGSLYETDSERGYAHLLEHMVFRQSRYLGDGEAIPAFQRLGATFGSDTNAETSPVSTTFKLDLPGATAASLDESFRLLSGMMIAPTLSEANVRTDVPIVLAEKRERGGMAERLTYATQQTLFAGQMLAARPVIGTTETLQAANQASVRAFHARWYRPENAVIVVSGDADPAQLAALVRKYFGDWKGTGKPVPAPSFGDPVLPAGSGADGVGETRVVVEPDVPRGITYTVMRPWRQVHDTVIYNQGIMVDSLAQAIINRRLEARARGGGSFLAAQVSQEKISRSADATFVSITPLGENWKKALADVRGVIADALASAPSQDEIDREVAEMNVAFESTVEQRRLQPGAKLADDIVTALDIRETVAAPETVLDIFNRSRPLFTPQAVLDHTHRLFTGTVTRGIYVTPKAGEADAAALKLALAAPVKADDKARLDSKPISFADLPPIGTPGKVASATPTTVLEIEQLELSNGIKVLFWPTVDEPGRVTVKVRFGAGYRTFQSGDAAYIALGDMALVGSGEGSLGQEELDRISTGRKMGFDFAIEDTAFQFSANTRGADLADQLYLFAAKFAMPRWDANPVLRAKAAAKLQYESYATSPQGVIQRDLGYYQHGRDGRFRTATPQEVEAATVKGFRQVWEPVLQEGPIELQVFGDFDRAQAVSALEKTFGALAPRKPLPAGLAKATFPDMPASPGPIVLEHRGDPGQAAAVINWPTGGGMAGITESRQLEILAQVFSNRLLDAMREKLGASYSPQVYNSWPADLGNGGAIVAMAQLQPKAVPVFFATADEIASELIARPPSADELARVTEPLKQQLTRAYTSSAFFMSQLEGATEDQRKFSSLRSLLPDMTRTTPQAMQALAAKYLKPGSSWRLAVIPAGQKLATELPVGTRLPGAGR
ncbi:MAG: insulinase family protein [Proteobacteria bacterium]|nr:insulinase family protein [Pseudomonadota bacterium]